MFTSDVPTSEKPTSEEPERKFPTLSTKRFSESTCDALLSLLLRGCSTRTCDEQSTLDDLAGSDENFARWRADLRSEMRLAVSLVHDPIWRDGQPPTERLWQMANVAIRLHALEQQFSDELVAQKREAIYHFAYGLSHELNNPLANIATRAGVLVHREVEVNRRQMLESIIDNAMRGSEMLGDLMLLARPPKLNIQSIELADWFATFVDRCSKWASTRNLKIDSKCDVQSMTANFDPVAITEAAWCLVRNAFEASAKKIRYTYIFDNPLNTFESLSVIQDQVYPLKPFGTVLILTTVVAKQVAD